MGKIILTIALLLAIIATMIFITSSNSEYTTKQTQDAISRNVVMVDIRRLEEWKKYGTIKGSHKITFFNKKGQYNINKWMFEFEKIVKSKNQEFILICAHANRTKVVLKFLQEELKYTNAHDLEGGINYGWIDKNLKTIPY